MKKLWLLLIPFLFISCERCISRTIEPVVATVVATEYKPAKTYTTMQPVVRTIGKTTTVTMLPVSHYDPPEYNCTVQYKTEEGIILAATFDSQHLFKQGVGANAYCNLSIKVMDNKGTQYKKYYLSLQ